MAAPHPADTHFAAGLASQEPGISVRSRLKHLRKAALDTPELRHPAKLRTLEGNESFQAGAGRDGGRLPGNLSCILCL